MSRYDLVIFDCDGVLVDSESLTIEIEAEALTDLGFPITPDEVAERYSGMTSFDMAKAIEAETGAPLHPDFLPRVRRQTREAYRTRLEPIRGTEETLRALQVPFCVASSSVPDKLALGLVECGLFNLCYPNIFSAHLVERGKPAPDIFRYAAEKMGAAPTRCVVIEDSLAGVKGAVAAGMDCYGLLSGGHIRPGHGDALMKLGAVGVLSELSELHEVLNG
ncbi:MAG: HAD family hydrolase [Pseudomonadota bacterium]